MERAHSKNRQGDVIERKMENDAPKLLNYVLSHCERSPDAAV